MAPKMRDDAAKAKARAAAEAKKKVSEEEKKMYVLQQRLDKIRKAKLDEHNWLKHWVKMRDWTKSENARNVTTARIKSYLNAPIVDNFGTFKEEVIKFIIS